MKAGEEILLAMFEEFVTEENCPIDQMLIVWDGCDFHLDYVSIDVDTGRFYFANNTSAVAYLELPDYREAELVLGDGE